MAGLNVGVRNGQLVDHVGSAIHHGTESLDVIPKLLRQLLETQAWREFRTKLGEDVAHERFTDFVTTPPLKGLGTRVDTLENICRDDPDALRELRKATVGQAGAHSPSSNRTRRGTTKAYTLVKLEADRPDLHERVIAGKLSANAAAVEAGWRPRMASVPIDNLDQLAAALRRRLDPLTCVRLAELLLANADNDGYDNFGLLETTDGA